MTVALILLALVLGVRHGMAPDHLAAVGTLVEKTQRRPKASLSAALRLGAGHSVGMLAIAGAILGLAWKLPPQWDLWTGWASGIWLVLVAAWVLLDLARDLWPPTVKAELAERRADAPPRVSRWTERPWAAWAVGLIFGIAVSPGDLAIYTVLMQNGHDPLQALTLLATFLAAMLGSLAIIGAGLGFGNTRTLLRRGTQAFSGVAGMGVGLALLTGFLH